jgi:hypothetical protein
MKINIDKKVIVLSSSALLLIFFLIKSIRRKYFKKKKIYITGFGPFNGVNENPSQKLMELFKNKNINNEIKSIDIIETSIQGVDDYFEKKISDESSIFIHFGVNNSLNLFNIENRAKNGNFFP